MKQCIGCENTWEVNSHNYRKKFCSQSCAAKYNNSLRYTRSKCVCGNKTKDHRTEFCSRECKTRNSIKLWLEDEKSSPCLKYGGIPAFIRTWLKETQGEKCSICGFNEKHPVSGNVVVEIDHIDGNWKNNRPHNLRFLCPNHHALTSTYRGYNMGNGRDFRNK